MIRETGCRNEMTKEKETVYSRRRSDRERGSPEQQQREEDDADQTKKRSVCQIMLLLESAKSYWTDLQSDWSMVMSHLSFASHTNIHYIRLRNKASTPPVTWSGKLVISYCMLDFSLIHRYAEKDKVLH